MAWCSVKYRGLIPQIIYKYRSKGRKDPGTSMNSMEKPDLTLWMIFLNQPDVMNLIGDGNNDEKGCSCVVYRMEIPCLAS
jgi:hypothetical protein